MMDADAESADLFRKIVEDAISPEEQVEALLTTTLRSNDERGFLKFCTACRAWTRHLFLPDPDRAAQRCMRCGKVLKYDMIVPRDDLIQKPLMLPPKWDGDDLLRFVVAVFGPSFLVKVMEVWHRKRVKEYEVAFLQAMKEERDAEKATLLEMSVL